MIYVICYHDDIMLSAYTYIIYINRYSFNLKNNFNLILFVDVGTYVKALK